MAGKQPSRVRLVAIDLDGTLLDGEGALDSAATPLISRILEKGACITLATGRDPYSARHLSRPIAWSFPLVTCNGAVVWDVGKERPLMKRTIPLKAVRDCIDCLPEFGLAPFVMEITPDHRFVVRPTSQGDSFHEVVKLYASGDIASVESAKAGIKTLLDGTIYTTSSFHGNLEICPAGVSKASGLDTVARALGILPEEIACIGDGENDLELFGYAGVRVAMGNAIEPLKAMADFVAPSNTEHGVAEALAWILSTSRP